MKKMSLLERLRFKTINDLIEGTRKNSLSEYTCQNVMWKKLHSLLENSEDASLDSLVKTSINDSGVEEPEEDPEATKLALMGNKHLPKNG